MLNILSPDYYWQDYKYELKQYALPWEVTFSKAIHNGGNVTFTAKGNTPMGEQ